MRFRLSIMIILASFCLPLLAAAGTNTTGEQEIINKYVNQTEKKYTKKMGWASVNFTMNRINRNNDYNKFVNYQNNFFTNTKFSWLAQGWNAGIDMGLIFKEKFAWSVRGEYWMPLKEAKSGTFEYTPTNSATSFVTDPTSEVKVWGVATGLQYYVLNAPSANDGLQKLAVRVGGSVGYYQATWDVWPASENLNLSTSQPAGLNTSFKGSAPGFSMVMGADYPAGFWGMGLGVDFGYTVLNFKNMAWYNTLDQEVVLTYNGNQDGRVDLNLSGFTGKVEIKRFFSW